MIIILPDTTLFRNIRYLRARYHLSRKALGALTGLSPSVIKCMENESVLTFINKQALMNLCRVFDVTVEDMLHSDMEKGIKLY